MCPLFRLGTLEKRILWSFRGASEVEGRSWNPELFIEPVCRSYIVKDTAGAGVLGCYEPAHWCTVVSLEWLASALSEHLHV